MIKKRVLALLLALVLVAGLLPAAALAADAEPTEIATADGLKQLKNAAEGSQFVLTADITLPEDWTPITASWNDNVVLDGNGHTVTLNGSPLFEDMYSLTVSNLVLAGQVTSDSNVASLAKTSGGTVRNCVSYADVTYTGQSSSYTTYYAAGLIAYINEKAGTVENCVYAGSINLNGAEIAYGAISNYYVNKTGTMENCIGVGFDKIGFFIISSKATGWDEVASPIDPGITNTLITDKASFNPADYIAKLNQNRDTEAGDLEWEVKDGKLTLKRAAGEAPEATAEEIAALQAAVTDAGTAAADKVYTADSWKAYSDALSSAQNILQQTAPKQNVVVNATNKLTAAVSGLTERTLAAVDLSDKEVTAITSVSDLESMQAGKNYRLDADIEIKTSDYYYTSDMNAVFDGNGHTITISAKNKTIWKNLGPDAIVQNIGVKGSVSSSNNAGAIAQSSEGLIVNCWSQADVTTTGMNDSQKHTGGLVGELKSGGAIVNCYVAGSVTAKGSNANGSAGIIAGNTEANSLIQTCYGLTDNFKGIGDGVVNNCEVKARKDFYSTEFITLLNKNRGTYGREWTLSSEGYPHLGEAQEYIPPEAVTITFTYHDGRTVSFKSDESLTISLQDAIAEGQERYQAGMFSMPGAESWHDTIVGNKDVLLVTEDGTLSVYKPGSADVVAVGPEADGSEELVRFTVTVVQGGEIDGFRLVRNGAEIDGTLTVQGSEEVTLTPQIRRGGSWTAIPASQVEFSHTGALHRVDGTFYAEEPGSMTLTAKYTDQTATVQITSEFVAVTSITPAPSGSYTIHQHNPNSSNMGNFLDLTLSHGAGSVVVQPDNASYRDRWTMSSSDPSVAEYVSSMIHAVLPYKAGTTTLTAVVEANGQQPRVTGTSTITIEYENPVKSVSVSPAALTVKENESISLPITFTGEKAGDVTEPAMDWTFTSADGGAAEIVRDGALGIWEQDGEGNKPCVANPNYKLNGVTAGTLTVTGTPKDTTGGAQPVTFTVTVEPGTPLPPADNAALTTEGIANAQTYLTANSPSYAYGNEWEIFSLRRSGQTIDQSKIDAYLNSVETTYKNQPDATAMKPTTIARVALTLGALGENAADFRGLNFAEMLYNSSRIGEGGNEPMWALIALDSRGYTVPSDAMWTRDKLITELIVHYQTAEGGFGLNDNKTASVDITAMAVQALAPHCSARQDVKAAVDKAISWLKSKMSADCGFDGNAESAAQVVLAITAMGMDPVDSKNGFVRSEVVNLLTNLIGFAHSEGGYKHYTGDQGAQSMSTTQVLMAFEAYRRFTAGESRLYDLTDAADTRSVLSQRLAEAKALQQADYTAESWATLQKAVTEAQAVLDNGSAGEAELKAAGTALASALTGLSKVPSGGGGTSGVPQESITVTFRLVGDTKHNSADRHDKYSNWIRTMSVTVPKGSTVFDVFEAALDRQGMRFEERQTSYISGIQAPSVLGGYWLREFDNGPRSGWKYLVNGDYPDVGLRYYWPSDGDTVVWRYVDDYTDTDDNNDKWQEAEDTAPTASGGGGGGTITRPEDKIETSLNPEVEVNNKGEANAVIDDKALSNTIADAKTDKADVIVIAPEVKGDASKVSVELPKSGVDNIAKQTDADLMIETDIADITIPQKSLEDLAGQSGSKVTISAEAVKGTDNVKLEVAVNGKSVEKLSGGITVSVPARDEKSGNVLVIVNSDGSETIVKKSIVDGKTVEAVLDGSCIVKVVDNSKKFSDTASHWSKDAVAFASSHELFSGDTANTFAPDTSMSRAMLATVLYRLEDAVATGSNAFTDVPEGTWYTDAVTWASNAGIVTGTGSGFDPNGNVTREQLATMLYRYAKTLGMSTSASGDLSRFSDGGKTSNWAKDAMEWAVGSGLISGKGNDILDPTGSATRAEVAVIMQRLIGLMVK